MWKEYSKGLPKMGRDSIFVKLSESDAICPKSLYRLPGSCGRETTTEHFVGDAHCRGVLEIATKRVELVM